MANKKKSIAQESVLEEKKEYLKHAFDFEKKKHDLKMKEFEYLRESDKLHHERELERGRIKSAEIRKTLMRKEQNNSYQY